MPTRLSAVECSDFSNLQQHLRCGVASRRFSEYHRNRRHSVNDLDWESLSKPVKLALKDGRLDRPLPRLSFALNWYHREGCPRRLSCRQPGNSHPHRLFTFSDRPRPLSDAEPAGCIPTRCRLHLPSGNGSVGGEPDSNSSGHLHRSAHGGHGGHVLHPEHVRLPPGAPLRVSREQVRWRRCVLSFALGLASKENAALLPLMLFAIELCFFQDLGLMQTRRRLAVAGLVVGILLLGLGSFIFLKGDPLSVLATATGLFHHRNAF